MPAKIHQRKPKREMIEQDVARVRGELQCLYTAMVNQDSLVKRWCTLLRRHGVDVSPYDTLDDLLALAGISTVEQSAITQADAERRLTKWAAEHGKSVGVSATKAADDKYLAEDFAAYSIPTSRLSKARSDGRLPREACERRNGRWYYSRAAVALLWPHAFKSIAEE